MDKNALTAETIKKASNNNLIKLAVEHYLSIKEGGEGLLSQTETDAINKEANKRGIMGGLIQILNLSDAIFFVRRDLNEANLWLKFLTTQLQLSLVGYKTIFTTSEVQTTEENGEKVKREILEKLSKQETGRPHELDGLIKGLEVQTSKAKMCLHFIHDVQRLANYPIINKVTDAHIKETRFNIHYLLGKLGDLVGELLYSFESVDPKYKEYLEKRTDLATLKKYLTTLDTLIDAHARLSEEDMEHIKKNGKSIKEATDPIEKLISVWGQIPFEDKGLTDKDKRIINLNIEEVKKLYNIHEAN